MKLRNKMSLGFIGFLQAFGLVAYCSLVGALLLNGEKLFGTPKLIVGPIVFLLIFIISAIVSASLVLAYPFIIFWDEKNTKKALRLVAYTTAWLFVFVLLFIFTTLTVR